MARAKGSGPTSTSLKKGESGNPAGRPKVDPELKGIAKAHSIEATEKIIAIMRDLAVIGVGGVRGVPRSDG